MPFTPFHFGPGATVKAMAGQHFSFTVFAFTQVAIDLEPLYFMLRDEDRLIHHEKTSEEANSRCRDRRHPA